MQEKKNSTWGIKKIDNVKIENIKKEVELFDDEWFIDTSRQESYKVHKKTFCYSLIYLNYDWLPGDSVKFKNMNMFKNKMSQLELKNIYSMLESIYDGKVVGSELIKMSNNTKINKHIDGGDILYFARRIHVPIITTDGVIFNVNKDSINMKEGICYEINNAMPHSVENPTDIDRVHLIIDIMPNEFMI